MEWDLHSHLQVCTHVEMTEFLSRGKGLSMMESFEGWLPNHQTRQLGRRLQTVTLYSGPNQAECTWVTPHCIFCCINRAVLFFFTCIIWEKKKKLNWNLKCCTKRCFLSYSSRYPDTAGTIFSSMINWTIRKSANDVRRFSSLKLLFFLNSRRSEHSCSDAKALRASKTRGTLGALAVR